MCHFDSNWDPVNLRLKDGKSDDLGHFSFTCSGFAALSVTSSVLFHTDVDYNRQENHPTAKQLWIYFPKCPTGRKNSLDTDIALSFQPTIQHLSCILSSTAGTNDYFQILSRINIGYIPWVWHYYYIIDWCISHFSAHISWYLSLWFSARKLWIFLPRWGGGH